MSDQTLAAVKKIKGVTRNLSDCIDLLWMLELKKQKGMAVTQNVVDDDMKKLQSQAKVMQDKLTEMVGGIKLDGPGPEGSNAAAGGEGFDVGHFDKDKAEAAALATLDSIPFNMNPFFWNKFPITSSQVGFDWIQSLQGLI